MDPADASPENQELRESGVQLPAENSSKRKDSKPCSVSVLVSNYKCQKLLNLSALLSVVFQQFCFMTYGLSPCVQECQWSPEMASGGLSLD